MKKPTGSVRFRFFKPRTGKTEPNRKTEKNRAKPVGTGFCSKKPNQTEPKPVGLSRFQFF
jgi:hypothetical protein